MVATGNEFANAVSAYAGVVSVWASLKNGFLQVISEISQNGGGLRKANISNDNLSLLKDVSVE